MLGCEDAITSSNQLGHRAVIGDEVLGAAGEVGELGCRDIDSHPMIQRGEDVAEVDRAVQRLFTQAVRRSDNLSAFHAAAGQ